MQQAAGLSDASRTPFLVLSAFRDSREFQETAVCQPESYVFRSYAFRVVGRRATADLTAQEFEECGDDSWQVLKKHLENDESVWSERSVWQTPQEGGDEEKSSDELQSQGVMAAAGKKRDFYKIDKTENRLRMRKYALRF